ncbi:TPA: fimbrial biogenesis outer membrane usher protein, partial [Escherichia coli]|nr:fimbrial biogenesis outer membrane usher protein [Escherichia coli]
TFKGVFSVKVLTFLFLNTLFWVGSSNAKKLAFDPNFLILSDGEAGKNIDLSFFSSEDGIMPGVYKVAVFVNNDKVDNTTLKFIHVSEGEGGVFPCVYKEDLIRWGINAEQHENDNCLILSTKLYPSLQAVLDLNLMEYRISLPQIYLIRNDWLRTSPQQWQDGIPALMINYNFSGNRQNVIESSYSGSSSEYLGVDSLLTVSGWRLYNTSAWRRDNNDQYINSLRTWLQKSYGFWQGGELTIGDNYISNDFFDSFSFKGIKIESDDGMLLPNLLDYSPIVRGVAYSQARVTVRQGGSVIYERNVPPGPFELRDLNMYDTSDLYITIREADGTERHLTQVSASLPILQREGRLKYSISAGNYDGIRDEGKVKPFMFNASAAWGLRDDYTVYGGTILSSNYQAYMAGLAKYNNFLGALAMDITWADAQPVSLWNGRKERSRGQSYRLSYARGFTTGSSLNISAYRHSSAGFYSFQDTHIHNIEDGYSSGRVHSRYTLLLSQPFEGYGRLSISGSEDSFWNMDEKRRNMQFTWSHTYNKVSLNASLGYSDSPRYKKDRTASLNISVPLSSLLSQGSMNFNTSTFSYNGLVSNQFSLSGSSFNSQLNWSVANSWSNWDSRASQSINMMWNNNYGQFSGGYAHYHDRDMLNYGIYGGLALHSGGITFSRSLSLSDGNALIDTAGVSGVPVKGNTFSSTDYRGYVILSGLPAFQKSNISLDMNRFSDKIESTDTDKLVIPSRGSLVPVQFYVTSGARAVITLIHKGESLPLGSLVRLSSKKHSVNGIVGDSGQVYLSGLPESGVLSVVYGSGKVCNAEYRLLNKEGFNKINLQCH